MRTYNQILETLGIFATAHEQVNSHGTGFKTDINEFLKNNDQLSFLFFEPVSITPNVNTTDFRFRIYCLDFKQKDNNNVNDVLSDTSQILIDLRKYLISNFEETGLWSVQFLSDTLIPVNNYTADYCVGWYMDINVSTGLIESDCDIPATPQICDPVKFYINETFVGESLSSFFIRVLQDSEEAGELVDGNWVVPSAGGGCAAFPIGINNTNGCQLGLITSCPETSTIVFPDIEIDDQGGLWGEVAMPKKIVITNCDIDSVSYADLGCTLQINLAQPFPIIVSNNLSLLLAAITEYPAGGVFNLPGISLRHIDGTIPFGTVQHMNNINIRQGTIQTITQSGTGDTLTITMQPCPICPDPCLPIDAVNSQGFVLATITECPADGEIDIPNITLRDSSGALAQTINASVGIFIPQTTITSQSYNPANGITTLNVSIPTLCQLITPASWATIQACLSPTQLAAAEAAICVPPTPSGIAYMRTNPFVFVPGGGSSITTGDTQWHFRNGTYEITSPSMPVSYAQLDYTATQADVRITPATGTLSTDLVSPTILLDNNSFGNKFRFTDSLGNPSNATVGSNLWAHVDWLNHNFTGAAQDYVIDHLTGFGYMIRFVTDAGVWRMNPAEPATSDTWAGWIGRISALNLAGFTDWMPLDACSLRPHYNKVSIQEGASTGQWAKDFFITPRTSGGPGGATDNRGSMHTGENADATNFWVLNDSGNQIQIQQFLKAGVGGFSGNITNIYPIRKHF